MALFRYFKREKGNLPDPHGPLARSVPSTSIAAANSEVSTAIDTASRNSAQNGCGFNANRVRDHEIFSTK